MSFLPKILEDLYSGKILKDVTDSKLLKRHERNVLYREIIKLSHFRRVLLIPAITIDAIGINPSIFSGIRKGVSKLPKDLQNPILLIDGNYKIPDLQYPYQSIVKGDQTEKIISCASILAKVKRDEYLSKISKLYPDYEFEKHFGYGTKSHIEAIRKLGYSAIHRKTYAIKSLRNPS